MDLLRHNCLRFLNGLWLDLLLLLKIGLRSLNRLLLSSVMNINMNLWLRSVMDINVDLLRSIMNRLLRSIMNINMWLLNIMHRLHNWLLDNVLRLLLRGLNINWLFHYFFYVNWFFNLNNFVNNFFLNHYFLHNLLFYDFFFDFFGLIDHFNLRCLPRWKFDC